MPDPVLALAAYLARHNLSQTAFADREKLDRSEVSHILARRRGAGVRYAVAIDTGTNGEVKAEWWGKKRRQKKSTLKRKRKAA